MRDNIIQNLNFVRERSLLIHTTTHTFTLDFVVNGLLAMGVSSALSNNVDELEEMIGLSSAVVINLGMLSPESQGVYLRAADIANHLGKPVILDPSGVDLTLYRTGLAHQLLVTHKVDIVRDNADEIMAISGQTYLKKSVDPAVRTQEAVKAGKDLSHRHNLCVVITGKEDAIIVKDRHRIFDYGHILMPRIAGIGCLLTSVLAAFHAVDEDPLIAASSGVVIYGMAGEIAAANPNVQGPGTFKGVFLDILHSLNDRDIEDRYRHN